MTLTEPTIAVPCVCEDCQGTLLRWRHFVKNPHEVVFYLSCVDCAETALSVTGEEFIEISRANEYVNRRLEQEDR